VEPVAPAQQSKRTAFFDIHRESGGKIVPFAGFEMPVQYSTGIVQEHRAVRSSVGVFDVSHMGEFEIRGKDAEAFLANVTVNDVSKLSKGQVQYSAMCYDEGGIVDDLLVYHMGDRYMLVVNASNIAKDREWLIAHCDGDVQLVDKSDDISLLAVQGPKSLATLQALTAADLQSIPYYRFVEGELAGVPMIISRTGYTGELGFELYFKAEDSLARRVWDAIFEAGKEYGIVPVGLGARDTLRLEMGYCLYGNDIDQTTNPLEAGLGWITKLSKSDFIGKKALLDVKAKGLRRKLVGFHLPGRTLARHGYKISSSGGEIGHVTSGTFSPTLDFGIGLGYVLPEHASPGTSLTIKIREKEVEATVVPLPFVHKK